MTEIDPDTRSRGVVDDEVGCVTIPDAEDPVADAHVSVGGDETFAQFHETFRT